METAKIYKITNTINEKVYVGQTRKSLELRFERHKAESRWESRKRMLITQAMKKHGSHNFSICLLEDLGKSASQHDVDLKEAEWGLALLALTPTGYNLKLGKGRGTVSDETRKKISLANKGRIVSDETRRRSSISHTGYKRPEPLVQQQRDRMRGQSPSQNTRLGSSLKNSKTFQLIDPNGVPRTITNMRKFCQENGHQSTSMCRMIKGKIPSYKGWTIQ